MDAARNEVDEPTEITVEWRGEKLTLPATLDDAPLEVLELFEKGKAVGAMRGILGDRQLDRLTEKLGLKVRDFSDLADVVAREMGFGSSGE
jgi:hypothetical protein